MGNIDSIMRVMANSVLHGRPVFICDLAGVESVAYYNVKIRDGVAVNGPLLTTSCDKVDIPRVKDICAKASELHMQTVELDALKLALLGPTPIDPERIAFKLSNITKGNGAIGKLISGELNKSILNPSGRFKLTCIDKGVEVANPAIISMLADGKYTLSGQLDIPIALDGCIMDAVLIVD
jgi:hypothetical protein